MSPREKHLPDNARRTSVCLTPEDRAAVWWITEVRRARGDKRTTTNDILVDALWFFLEQAEGRTKEQIQAFVPKVSRPGQSDNKVAQMPKKKAGTKR